MKRKKPKPIKVRNEVARAAWERQGAGSHKDPRLAKQRSRQASKSRAVSEQM